MPPRRMTARDGSFRTEVIDQISGRFAVEGHVGNGLRCLGGITLMPGARREAPADFLAARAGDLPGASG